MRSHNEKLQSNQIDELYWELCVLQACAFGVQHVASKHYDSLAENMECALLHECARVMELLKGFEQPKSKSAGETVTA